MTLRANITTTYRDANASPPLAPKKVLKEATDQGVHESDGTSNPVKPATKTPDQGAVPLAEHWGNRSAVRNNSQTSLIGDAFERSSPKEKSILAQGARSDNPASDWRPDTDENKAASKPALAGYGSGSGESITKRTVEESLAGKKHSATIPDRSQSEYSGSMVKRAAPLEPFKTDKGQEISNTDKQEALESLSQALPVAAPPKIRLAEPSFKAATANVVASPSTVHIVTGSVSAGKSDQSPSGVASGLLPNSADEDAMLRELTAALQFGQVQGDSSQTGSGTSDGVAKHLQSEGVFGISASGRSLGAVDFIRQKQFEYTMDQKPFTTDDLLLEAEKAINGTLNSDQSSAVSKSLLRAAESVNAYRNHSVKSSEHAEVAAKPSRVTAATGKEEA
jgi:hypothetical protein